MAMFCFRRRAHDVSSHSLSCRGRRVFHLSCGETWPPTGTLTQQDVWMYIGEHAPMLNKREIIFSHKRPPFILSLFPRNRTSLLFKQFSELVFVRLRSPQVSCFIGTRLAPPQCNKHGPAVSAPCCSAQNNPQRPETRVA